MVPTIQQGRDEQALAEAHGRSHDTIAVTLDPWDHAMEHTIGIRREDKSIWERRVSHSA